MKCVILQPSYVPWRGYFDQIRRADVFVFYDDVQYDRRGWRNRNKLKVPDGTPWLTIPVSKGHSPMQLQMICDMKLASGTPAALNHWSRIEQVYRDAPFFRKYEPFVRSFYQREDTYLADFTIATTIELAHALGIDDTDFARSSSLGAVGRKSERLISILERLGADHYISGPAARSYIDEDLFQRHGITVEYMEYKYPEYTQLHSPFDGFVSALDLLFMMGPDAPSCFGDDSSS